MSSILIVGTRFAKMLKNVIMRGTANEIDIIESTEAIDREDNCCEEESNKFLKLIIEGIEQQDRLVDLSKFERNNQLYNKPVSHFNNNHKKMISKKMINRRMMNGRR